MNKQEVIKYLEKKRETALDNFEYYRDKENEKYETMNRVRVDSYTIAIQAVEQIDEPQAEKVEVPDFVAPFIEKLKTTGRRYGFELEKAYASGEDADLSEWLGFNENVLTVFKALENGYTVKPKRWVVKFGSNLAYYFNGWYTDASIRPNGHSNKGDSSVIVFTDKSKAEAVATLVDGTVEEA